jgi:hypothetical protein
MKLPSAKEVADVLTFINASAEGELDVRLQVYPSGKWAVRWGLPDYDLDHHGFWGAGIVDGGELDSIAEARALLDQVQEGMQSC